MVVVQEIRTRWTKASRGAPAASRRNDVPSAVPIPRGNAADLLLHRVEYDERRDFVPEVLPTPAFSSVADIVSGLECREDAKSLIVAYIWNHSCGAPSRPHGRRIRLAKGEWCRLIHNGRFGYDSGWSYQSTVLNVGYVELPKAEMFFGTDHKEISDHRRDLW